MCKSTNDLGHYRRIATVNVYYQPTTSAPAAGTASWVRQEMDTEPTPRLT
jgi:hypothetical protein